MRQTIVIGFLLLALPASAQQDYADLTDWQRCIGIGARQLDDGKSDARSVAAAIVMTCRPARIEGVRDAMKGMPQPANAERIIAEEVDAKRAQDIDYVSALVLHRRAVAR